MNHGFLTEARWWWQDIKLLARRAIEEFVDDRCTQIAASISYYVFFSIFPLTIFLVTIFGQVLRNDDVKDQVIDALLEILPLAPTEGREELTQALEGVATNLSLLGLLSVVGLIWSASAMMASLRGALNVAWDTNHRRPALRGKLVDILMVFMVGLLVAVSIVATGFRPFVQDSAGNVADSLGAFGGIVHGAMWLGTFLVPIIVSFTIFSALYRFVPAVRTSLDEIWPGALVAALSFEVAKTGFSFYIRNFGNYNAIYGSLGAVIVFMLFIFIAANILLIGAEVASEWPRVRAGHYDHGMPQREGQPEVSFGERMQDLIRQVLLGPETVPEHVEDHEIEDRNRRRRERHRRDLARRSEVPVVEEESDAEKRSV